MPARDAQAGGNRVNPLRRAPDLGEVANGGFVNDPVACAVAPLAAELLVSESRREAAGGKDIRQRLTVFDRRLDFTARLVTAGVCCAPVLVGHSPRGTVFADAQQGAPAAQRAAG